MKRSNAQAPSRFLPAIKIGGGIAAVGLHLAVLGMVLFAPPAQLDPGPKDLGDVYFVELSDVAADVVENAGEETADAPPDPQSQPEPVSEPEPEAATEPPTEAEPEPMLEPEPEPEPVVEPEPEPEPEPAPTVEPEPEPEPVVEPEPKPQPKPEPKPQPKPEPQPKPKPKERLQPKPQAAPVPKIRVQEQSASAANSAPKGTAAKASAPAATQASAPPSDKPRTISAVDYLGKRPIPVYPRASQRRREEGRVVVRVLISTQGSVLEASLQSSSGSNRLDEAALKAARTARFRPYTENGTAYRAMADLPFDFVL